MSNLGSPQTNSFSIGTAELRVGALTLANKLLTSHSVGLVDNVAINVEQTTVPLMGGFPRRKVDEAIVSQDTTVTATMREQSRRNLNMMLGNGVATSNPTDVSTTMTVFTDDENIEVASVAGFAVGDVVVVYPEGRPGEVSVVKIASISTPDIGFEADTPLLYTYDPSADTVHIFKAFELTIGNSTTQNYFTASVVQENHHTGRPRVWNFWKVSSTAGMTYGTNAEDYASNELTLSVMQPSACEYAVGGDLEHLADIIPDFPLWIFAPGTDADC